MGSARPYLPTAWRTGSGEILEIGMKVAYFDCIGGASGDMLLGALVDAGAPEAALREAVAALRLPGVDLRFERVMKGGLSALQASVITPREQKGRRYLDLVEILEAAALSGPVKSRALAVLKRLAGVEAAIHGVPLESVHLHELGGDDTLADIAGVLAGMQALQVERAACSPLPLGRGWTQSAHGPLPLPAPATLALLEGVPVRPVEVEIETVTPTGAVLLTELAEGFGSFPSMQLLRVGSGAGRRDLPYPNIIRIWLGQAQGVEELWTVEELAVVETNIDDLNPQVYAYVMERLLAADALDVSMAPVQMKKNRPGVLLSVLCRPGDQDAVARILFQETTTLGVRRSRVERVSLPRSIQTVETPFGLVRVKVASWEGGVRVTPEFEDCRIAAEAHGAPLIEVMEAARAGYKPFS
jgi:uncharacterized protein (TIGR00299 family) protein